MKKNFRWRTIENYKNELLAIQQQLLAIDGELNLTNDRIEDMYKQILSYKNGMIECIRLIQEQENEMEKDKINELLTDIQDNVSSINKKHLDIKAKLFDAKNSIIDFLNMIKNSEF